MKHGTKRVLQSYKKPLAGDRGGKITAMKNALKENAKASQETLLNLLNEKGTFSAGIDYESLWISNELYIRGATLDVLKELEKHPNVASIYQERILEPETFSTSLLDEDGMKHTPEWGLQEIKVPDVWSNGISGKGIKIGSIDTGAHATHESISENYVGLENYGWFEPHRRGKSTPSDYNGHGTHTIGTMVGKGGIGIAPDAQWMACVGCTAFGCSEYAVKSCGQFMTCPHDPEDNNEDCSLAPHIVSNSWGDSGADYFDEVIDAWHEADIIPVFSMGNNGRKGCGVVNYPGEHPRVIAVGATTTDNSIAEFSSRGPPASNTSLIKPDITAPGHEVRSAWISTTSDSTYNTISGTSMACPHVSGVIALLLEENPDADFDTIYEILMKTTMRNLLPNDSDCGDIASTTFPNFIYGNGLIDGFESWTELTIEKNKQSEEFGAFN